MGIVEAAAIFALALAIVIAALILRSAITAAIKEYRQIAAKQQEGLVEYRQSFTKLSEVLVKISKVLETVGEGMANHYLQMYDYNVYNQFSKLVSAMQDGCAALEKLVPPESEQANKQ